MTASDKPSESHDDPAAGPSYGNMSERHWSKTRGERNREAIDYYRERSKAPGVEDGGGPRNFYCMECDGVIPHQPGLENCPHCGANLDGEVRRYFNWVEIDRPPTSDMRAVLPLLALVAGALLALVWGVRELLR